MSGRGATPEGKKELVGFQVGLKAPGLVIAPEDTIGDGALGFWKVLEEVFSSVRHQRCWAYKAANILPPPPAD